jgi:DNA-binding response OmpR family regulator
VGEPSLDSEGVIEAVPTVLVADDDPSHRGLLRDTLRSQRWTVREASDGEAALDAVRRWRPEVVVCDWMMPRRDGLSLVREVRKDPETRPTHIVLVTGLNESDRVVTALDAGADDFLRKPYDVGELLARVRAGLRHRRIQRELVRAQHRTAVLRLAATLGHEINNPLTGLLGHLELGRLFLDKGDAARVRHHLTEAGLGAHRVGNVTRRLVAMSDPRTVRYLDRQWMLDLDVEPVSTD